jgi:hypothetical protein
MSSGTVSPIYSEQDGSVVDFELSGGFEGFRSSDNDIVELNDGTRHHVFENASIDEGEYTSDQYYDALVQSDERIPDAIAWAGQNLPQDLIVTFNEAIDNDDVDTVQQYLEYILEQFSSTEQLTEQDSEQVEEEGLELTEQDQQVIDAITEQLAEEPPLGNEAADEWESLSEQAAASGDQTYADIAALTSSYHAGQISAEEAINWVFQNHSIQDIGRVYSLINSY